MLKNHSIEKQLKKKSFHLYRRELLCGKKRKRKVFLWEKNLELKGNLIEQKLKRNSSFMFWMCPGVCWLLWADKNFAESLRSFSFFTIGLLIFLLSFSNHSFYFLLVPNKEKFSLAEDIRRKFELFKEPKVFDCWISIRKLSSAWVFVMKNCLLSWEEFPIHCQLSFTNVKTSKSQIIPEKQKRASRYLNYLHKMKNCGAKEKAIIWN